MKREYILLVDDDAGCRSALEALLHAEGFATVTAGDGAAALAEARRAPPAAVLTDLQMPLMDGVELCQRLHEFDPTLPVIIMTAHTDMQPVIDSLRAGAEERTTWSSPCWAMPSSGACGERSRAALQSSIRSSCSVR